MNQPRILVVDDEPQIQRFLSVALSAAGFRVQTAETGAQALRLAATGAPDLIVLDLGLPDRDGKDVLRDIRQFSTTPVIVLSARDREAEKIEALDLGADDYVEKPFGIGELTARLRAALRHAAHAAQPAQRIEIDGVAMDFDKRLVTRDGAPIKLTPKEYDLLAVLYRNAGRVVTHRQILAAVWGPAHGEDTQYLRSLHRPAQGQDRTRSDRADDRQNRAGRRLPRRRALRRITVRRSTPMINSLAPPLDFPAPTHANRWRIAGTLVAKSTPAPVGVELPPPCLTGASDEG